jgi:2-polyprenyl-3-methyl-5-hydroxy-6-metoxy-1,4-benzoquinol methylase
MYDTESNTAFLFETLHDFYFINLFLSRSRGLLQRYVFNDILRRKCKNFTILDIGSGAGDIARWFVRYARKKQLKVTVICIDNDSRCIDFAKHHSINYPEIIFKKMSALDLDTLPEEPDYIFANHFLHHIDSHLIPDLIRQINQKAKIGFLINDLLRSNVTYALFFLLYPLLGCRAFTWSDGLLSIRKGFTLNEINSIVKNSGLFSTVLTHKMIPGRIVVTNL